MTGPKLYVSCKDNGKKSTLHGGTGDSQIIILSFAPLTYFYRAQRVTVEAQTSCKSQRVQKYANSRADLPNSWYR